MFLSADAIKKAIKAGELSIEPFDEKNLKVASYNFTLDDKLTDPVTGNEIAIPDEDYKLLPGKFLLGRTREIVNLKGNFICLLGTRSTVAQTGVDVLQSSTIAEPGTNSKFTLEITNHSSQDVLLVAGMRIVKGIFGRLE